MKIFHFSDTHLGLGIDTTSREEDFYVNFGFIFDEIKRTQPDIIVHTGDLFHTAKPSNKAISIAVKYFLEVQKLGIPFLLLAGNHDTPRLSTTTHSFEIFQNISNMKLFYLPEIQNIEVKGVNFVILPHIHDENIFKQELAKTPDFFKENKKNIFLSHFGLSGKEYEDYTDEISGVNITLEDIKNLKKFDYIGLGHYHKSFCIGNICYPGSLEHTSFNQKNYKIGYNLIDISGEKSDITSHSLPTRPMIDLGEISVDGIDTMQGFLDFIEQKIDIDSLKNALVKLTLTHLSHSLILDFDENSFLKLFQDTFYFEYKKFQKQLFENTEFQIQSSEDIIYSNFEKFYSNILQEIPKDLQEKVFQDITTDLKNIG